MKLSIVTTLYQSRAFVQEFHRRASMAARAITDDYELIFVDDGSPDDALALAVACAAADSRVKVIELSRNFGHHRAMMTGLDHAQGDFVFLLDVDLEEDPAWLADFWRTLQEHKADVVYGYQVRRKGWWLERAGGAVFWWATQRLWSHPIPRNLVTARLMTRDYVRSLVRHTEQKTAIAGLWAITGYRQVGLAVTKGHRGGSSYSFSKRFSMGVEAVTSFSDRPLLFVFWLGAVIFALASAGALYLVIRRLMGGVQLSGYPSLIVSIWMLGGLSIASIGVVGLYTARIFIETKGRPYVVIRRIHNGESSQ